MAYVEAVKLSLDDDVGTDVDDQHINLSLGESRVKHRDERKPLTPRLCRKGGSGGLAVISFQDLMFAH